MIGALTVVRVVPTRVPRRVRRGRFVCRGRASAGLSEDDERCRE